MDKDRFDRFVRRFDSLTAPRASRRSVFAGVAAALLTTGAAGAGTVMAAGCAKDGALCDHKRPRQCCSGNCKKAGNKHRCAPTPDALGCTVRDDLCAGRIKTCPGAPDGGCVVRDDGRPFCAGSGQCFPCATDGDCDEAFMGKGGVCVKCPACTKSSGRSFCAFPAPLS